MGKSMSLGLSTAVLSENLSLISTKTATRQSALNPHSVQGMKSLMFRAIVGELAKLLLDSGPTLRVL